MVVHYNGQRFDIPWLNTEFLLHKLPPPTPFKQVDLLKTTRSKFRHLSNKLDYVSRRLDIGEKVKHHGMQLWLDCMDGCPKAWALMKRYNKKDVQLLEDYYNEILPWIDNHPNYGLYIDANKPTCRNCGSTNVKKNGMERKTSLAYQRWKCNDCGRHLRSRICIAPAPEGILL
jgi:DNA polymerase III epsilon subunit-like protein